MTTGSDMDRIERELRYGRWRERLDWLGGAIIGLACLGLLVLLGIAAHSGRLTP